MGIGRVLTRPLRRAELEVEAAGFRLTGGLVHREMLEQLAAGHEPFTRELLCSHIDADTTVLDVGANLGWYSLLAARLGAHVIAVEPDPRTVPYLRANLERNGLHDRVSVRPVAVGDRVGQITLHLTGGAAQSSTAHDEGADARVDVDLMTVDALAPSPATIDVMKIDVEGAEVAVLRGLADVVARSDLRVILVECAPAMLRAAGSSPDALVGRLSELGFVPKIVDEERRELRLLDDGFWDGSPSWFNLYCIPA
jgi:FkbM family methyltransferase